MLKILLSFIIFVGSNIIHADTVTIQSTTSTRDSGLYKYLLPFYPKYKETQIKVVAVGTGQAITNARNCDGGILIVHDKKRETEFMKNNYGSVIHNLMFNDYIIIGPKEDLAQVSGSRFISRSDSSGTHAAEMSIWTKSGLDPTSFSGSWYLESGQGMGPSLNIATSLGGYTLTDRSSWLRFQNKANHTILYENAQELRNDYSMILVNHARCQNLNYEAAKSLYNWLKSAEVAQLIIRYEINNNNVFYVE